MEIEINDTKYEMVMGSDLERDGMYMELSVRGSEPYRLIAEVFYSDQTHEYFVNCFEKDVPMILVEKLIQQAKVRLPEAKE